MKKNRFYPKKIYVEKKSLDFPLTKKILENTSFIPFEEIENAENLQKEINTFRDPIGEGKKIMLVTRQKGEFVKPCPCTPCYLGCNYYIINLDLNCPLDCSYCILQLYLSNPFITLHVNKGGLWKQLDHFFKQRQNKITRIGTGELGDSLALDHITENSIDLINYFRNRKNVLFELKTKTNNIENIIKVEPAPNIIIAWSLNSHEMVDKEEKSAPSVTERIRAAARVVKGGFKVAFHFDPIIYYKGWEDGYFQVIEELFQSIKSDSIAWISLGSLRFPPPLKPVIKKRFPSSSIIYSEMIRGMDGKLRYFKPIRKRLYDKIILWLRQREGNVPIYFCMESKEMWKILQKKEPRGKEDINRFLSSPLGLIQK